MLQPEDRKKAKYYYEVMDNLTKKIEILQNRLSKARDIKANRSSSQYYSAYKRLKKELLSNNKYLKTYKKDYKNLTGKNYNPLLNYARSMFDRNWGIDK